jgi:hypothetical protein
MRRALKIMLISGAFMVLVAGLGIYALVSKFNRDVVGIEKMQAERYNEVERIKALPELQAIVVSAGMVRAPFSHADVAAYALTEALLMQMSGPTGGRSAAPAADPVTIMMTMSSSWELQAWWFPSGMSPTLHCPIPSPSCGRQATIAAGWAKSSAATTFPRYSTRSMLTTYAR